jgi:hypothetical protein
MNIFEVTIPGTRINHNDIELARHIETIVSSMQGKFIEANIALNLFTNSFSAKNKGPDVLLAQYYKNKERANVFWGNLERDPQWQNATAEDKWHESQRLVRREDWSQGIWTDSLTARLPFLHAKSFLSALDTFAKLLDALKESSDMPSEVASLADSMKQAFPSLRKVRNSIQHHEDRIRGIGERGKPMRLLSLDGEELPENLDVLFLDNLDGSRYGTTMGNGHYGEVDISPESMKKLQEIFQALVNSFSWTGAAQYIP